MAQILGLSQRTVKFHRANITKKLEVPNLMAAVALKIPAYSTDNNESTQLRTMQSCWKNIGTKLPGHVYWKDAVGIYQGSNDAQAIFLGYNSGKDLIGKTDFDLSWKEQAGYLRQIDRQVIETQKEFSVKEIVNNPDEKKQFFSIKSPLYDTENKKIVGIIGISLDITTKEINTQTRYFDAK